VLCIVQIAFLMLQDTKASAEGEHSEIVQKLEEELRKERQRMMAVTGTLQDNAGGRAGMSMLELVDALRSEKQVSSRPEEMNTVALEVLCL